MKQEMQVKVLKELIEQLDTRTTCDAGKVVINPTSSYIDKSRGEREWKAFFEEHPQVLGLSGELPTPGSYFTNSDLGMPILCTRDKDGKFHAFLNACTHRGAQLTDEPRGEKSRFTCPFHGWTFTADGRLMGVRNAEQFGAVDKACHNLVELPSAEKYGLLFVHPQKDGVLDVDALLGAELAEELSNWQLAGCQYRAESVLAKPINWKIANDTFGEVYHFSSLHKDTLSNLLHGDALTYREYGRHHRLCLATKYLDVMRNTPEADWSLPMGGVVVYYLFPNIQLVLLAGMVLVARIYPDRTDVCRSVTRVAHFATQEMQVQLAAAERTTLVSGENLYSADTSAAMQFDVSATIELFVSTVEHEDYLMGEKTQLAASSGKIDHFLFGRNEPALHHFHNNYRAALGEPPLQEYKAA